jgi:hypothetical protein
LERGLNVNKKTAMIVSGAAGIILTASACSGETHEYQVSGLVQGQQIDYDCPGEDVAMDAVAFVTGKGGSSGGSGGRSSSSSSNSNSNSNGNKSSKSDSDSGAKSDSNRKNNSDSSNSDSGQGKKSSKPAAPKNKGVKLEKKPEKPQKLKGLTIPKLLIPANLKGCEEEYEIFVLAKDGYLYEQDVREADYRKCEGAGIPAGQKAKLFPLCTKG